MDINEALTPTCPARGWSQDLCCKCYPELIQLSLEWMSWRQPFSYRKPSLLRVSCFPWMTKLHYMVQFSLPVSPFCLNLGVLYSLLSRSCLKCLRYDIPIHRGRFMAVLLSHFRPPCFHGNYNASRPVIVSTQEPSDLNIYNALRLCRIQFNNGSWLQPGAARAVDGYYPDGWICSQIAPVSGKA